MARLSRPRAAGGECGHFAPSRRDAVPNRLPECLYDRGGEAETRIGGRPSAKVIQHSSKIQIPRWFRVMLRAS